LGFEIANPIYEKEIRKMEGNFGASGIGVGMIKWFYVFILAESSEFSLFFSLFL